MMETERASRVTPQLLMGLIIIAVGVAFTLDNLGMLRAERFLRYWPAGLVAIGMLKLWQSRGGGGAFAGLLFILAGTWLLLDMLGIVAVSVWEMWPLALVLVGASMVWQGLRGRGRDARDRSADGNATIRAVAILSGIGRASNSRAFSGGDLTAVMGGCEIDLRQAAIDGEATIEVFAMWGGIEIRVPDDWTVVGRVTPLLGGFEDQTRPPQGASAHRLVVRGLVIMGGIEVKN